MSPAGRATARWVSPFPPFSSCSLSEEQLRTVMERAALRPPPAAACLRGPANSGTRNTPSGDTLTVMQPPAARGPVQNKPDEHQKSV